MLTRRNRNILLSGAILALALGTGCKGPEDKLADHFEELTEIMEDHMDEPKEGVEELREYMRDNGPEMASLWAEMAVDLDKADGEDEKKERAEEMSEALAEPTKKLMEAGKKFGKKAMGDKDAMEIVEKAEKEWKPVALKIADAVSGGALTKYMNRAKTTEAIDQLDKMYKSAANYYMTPRVAKGTGAKIDCQFPKTQKLTPDVRDKACCGGKLDTDGDNRCDVDTTAWTTATWSALNFQMNDQHYFGYSFTSSGTLAAAKFTAAAHADLDCDGELSTFERYGYGDASASHAECSMKGSSAFFKKKETE